LLVFNVCYVGSDYGVVVTTKASDVLSPALCVVPHVLMLLFTSLLQSCSEGI